MNPIVFSISVVTGLLVEYFVGSGDNFVRKLIKTGQIGLNSAVFGLITPQDYNLIAIAYIVTPAVMRLVGFRLTPAIEHWFAVVIGKMYLGGESSINFINVVKHLWRQEPSECKRKRDRFADEGTPDDSDGLL